MIRHNAITLLGLERNRQVAIWGKDHDLNHTYCEWIMILSEQLGKISRVVLSPMRIGFKTRYLRFVIQLGAVCLAILEASGEIDIEAMKKDIKEDTPNDEG
jgi:hypothetical protein